MLKALLIFTAPLITGGLAYLGCAYIEMSWMLSESYRSTVVIATAFGFLAPINYLFFNEKHRGNYYF